LVLVFRFIHTADWQIGKPFGGFPAETAAVLRDARLTAIERIASAADGTGAAHVLVAGDIYEADGVPERVLRQPITRMATRSDLTWHLLPGNHDPARPGGVWERLARAGLPDNVCVYVSGQPCEIEPGVWLLPAPLLARSQSDDPTVWMDSADVPDGALRIGLAHGSIQDFGQAGEAEAIIAPQRAQSAGLAYLALGDWHGMIEINARTWYAGTPEPDRFVSVNPGYVLAVSLETNQKAPDVKPIATAQYTWESRSLSVSGVADMAGLEQELRVLAPSPDRLLLKLTLAGVVSLAERAAIIRTIDQLDPALRYLERDLTNLQARPDESDLEAFAAEGELATAAAYLRTRAEEASDDRGARVARDALERFYLLASGAERDA
jgi:DNA repair exonuclease SbcCD nuclease subunit